MSNNVNINGAIDRYILFHSFCSWHTQVTETGRSIRRQSILVVIFLHSSFVAKSSLVSEMTYYVSAVEWVIKLYSVTESRSSVAVNRSQ